MNGATIKKQTMNKVDKKLRFALFGNEEMLGKNKRDTDRQTLALKRVLKCLDANVDEIYIDKPFYTFLKEHSLLPERVAGVFEGYNFDVDFVASLGGDGTFLRAASRVATKGTPVMGVNMGRLGFLADILPSEIESMVDAICRNDYKIEEHTAVQISAEGEPIEGNPYALNDIAVLKRDNASMITIKASIDGEHLVTYQADGLIVSTPTGSTAYSLSNGGPIMVPQTHNLCLTPVAPHSLNIRPIVVSDNVEITLSVESRSHNFLVAIDGRSEKLREGTIVTIRKSPMPIRIVKRTDVRYFSTLREKMMWGIDQR